MIDLVLISLPPAVAVATVALTWWPRVERSYCVSCGAEIMTESGQVCQDCGRGEFLTGPARTAGYEPAAPVWPTLMQGGATVARHAHNVEVVGSNPTPAPTLLNPTITGFLIGGPGASQRPLPTTPRPSLGLATTEVPTPATLPPVGEAGEPPKGLGRGGNKPLMRNRSLDGSPDRHTGGNTFAGSDSSSSQRPPARSTPGTSTVPTCIQQGGTPADSP